MTRRALVAAVAAGALFWVLDAYVESRLPGMGPFRERLLGPVAGHEVVMRLAVVLVLLASAAAMSLVRRRERRAETERRESRRVLATLMSNLPGLAYRCRNDRDWTMEFVSDGCASLTGYAAEELLGNAKASYAELIHPDDREAVWRSVQAAVAERRPFELNYRIRRADGEERHVWERGRGVFAADGSLTALEGFITDVSKQRRAEGTLRGYAERLRNLREIDTGILAARSPAAIAQAAVERISKLVPCYRASVALFDFARRDMDLLAVWVDGELIVGPGVRYPLDASFGDLDRLRAGMPNETRDLLELPDPPPLLARLRGEGLRSAVVVPLVAGGQLLGTLNLGSRVAHSFTPEMVDIAREVATSLAVAILQSRLHEQVQREARELDRRVRERTADLEAFTHSVSHDLRAPLRAIDGFAEALEQTTAERLDDEGRRLLRVVRGNVAALRRLLDDLLAFYRLGHAPVVDAEVDLAAVAEAEFERARVEEPERALRLEVGALPRVRGDAALLRLALGNLIGNAVKYTRPRAEGVVGFHAAPGPDGATIFSVRDNGVGFDPENATDIFEVFRRLHPGDEFEGTGMGLAIVKRVIERHGGRVWAEASPGGGATFRFTLAGAAARATSGRAAAAEEKA